MVSPKLRCLSITENHPFLKIAPIKAEVVSVEDPPMVIFHEVVSDKEIETLKNLATRKLEKARAYNIELNASTASSSRTGKLAWLSDSDHKVFQILIQRFEDMSGLTMATSERFQVLNYGIGGHFAAHVDYFDKPRSAKEFEENSYENGDRLVTMLLYVSY